MLSVFNHVASSYRHPSYKAYILTGKLYSIAFCSVCGFIFALLPALPVTKPFCKRKLLMLVNRAVTNMAMSFVGITLHLEIVADEVD